MVIDVVLRFANENGVIDTADPETIEKETRSLTFKRAADGGIGELTHRFAFVTAVVALGDNHYRLQDLWYGHPFRLNDDDEPQGGLAFQAVFYAERLADGSLLFDRVVERGGWRTDYWMLPSEWVSPPESLLASEYLRTVIEKIDAHGGCAAQDPWIINWLWTSLPPGTDYDPTNDIAEAVKHYLRAD